MGPPSYNAQTPLHIDEVRGLSWLALAEVGLL